MAGFKISEISMGFRPNWIDWAKAREEIVFLYPRPEGRGYWKRVDKDFSSSKINS